MSRNNRRFPRPSLMKGGQSYQLDKSLSTGWRSWCPWHLYFGKWFIRWIIISNVWTTGAWTLTWTVLVSFYVFLQEGFGRFLPRLPSNDVSPLGGDCPRGNCNTSGDWVKWLCGHNWRSLRLHFTIFRSMAWCPWGSSYRWVKGQMTLLPQVSHYAYASAS